MGVVLPTHHSKSCNKNIIKMHSQHVQSSGLYKLKKKNSAIVLGRVPWEASAHIPQFCNVKKDEECLPGLPNFPALPCGAAVSSVSSR